ncbi:MAG: WecB/TagA/CpsF family glycosyltransferase [Planctomycetes bacterium]|nr:WecB/TagA/CpsF family glycosyltransferase [Planctomycetota bacterium]
MSAGISVPEAVDLLGVDVTPFGTYGQAIQCVGDTMASGQKSFWVAINPQKVYRAWHDPDLRAILHRADVGICDGVGVSLAAKILHGTMIPRCTGCDLFFKLIAEAAKKCWKVFLLGGSGESNRLASERLCQTYPGLQIVGRRDGFFTDPGEVVRQINESGAQMLFVAMGTPAQEKWIADHMDEIHANFFMGVGGTFDVAAGVSKRAPKLFRRTGLEFLYQLITQPYRWRRQIVYIPFMLRVFHSKLLGETATKRRTCA